MRQNWFWNQMCTKTLKNKDINNIKQHIFDLHGLLMFSKGFPRDFSFYVFSRFSLWHTNAFASFAVLPRRAGISFQAPTCRPERFLGLATLGPAMSDLRHVQKGVSGWGCFWNPLLLLPKKILYQKKVKKVQFNLKPDVKKGFSKRSPLVLAGCFFSDFWGVKRGVFLKCPWNSLLCRVWFSESRLLLQGRIDGGCGRLYMFRFTAVG